MIQSLLRKSHGKDAVRLHNNLNEYPHEIQKARYNNKKEEKNYMKKSVFLLAIIAALFIGFLIVPVASAPDDLSSASVAPNITSITPNYGPVIGGTAITLRGTNFVSGGFFGVTINNKNATSIVRINSTTIMAITPANPAGARTVMVTNNDGQNTTRTGGFRYIAPPTIANITPSSGPTAGSTAVTIKGTNFVSGGLFGVRINNKNATNIVRVNSTTITAKTPANPAGARTVVVINTDGQNATRTGGFTYIAPPTITTITPNSGSTAGGTAVTIRGTNFVTGGLFGVTINKRNATNIVRVNSTTITAKTPANPAGAKNVTVTNNDGQNVTRTSGFTYIAPPPAITSITPNYGPIAGGTAITIRGTNFLSGRLLNVTINNKNATNIVRVNSTTITAKTPTNSAGAQNVKVINGDGQNITRAGGFTYYAPMAPPTITSIYGGSGYTTQSTNITIYGTNFVSGGAFSVKIGTTGARNVVWHTTSVITATVPPSTTFGYRNITVTNLDGQKATVVGGFLYLPPVGNSSTIQVIGNVYGLAPDSRPNHLDYIQYNVALAPGADSLDFNKMVITYFDDSGFTNLSLKKDITGSCTQTINGNKAEWCILNRNGGSADDILEEYEQFTLAIGMPASTVANARMYFAMKDASGGVLPFWRTIPATINNAQVLY
jgi:hypothetical protein